MPDLGIRDTKQHRVRRGVYNAWAASGNTEQRFADLLNTLQDLRAPARYLERPLEGVPVRLIREEPQSAKARKEK